MTMKKRTKFKVIFGDSIFGPVAHHWQKGGRGTWRYFSEVSTPPELKLYITGHGPEEEFVGPGKVMLRVAPNAGKSLAEIRERTKDGKLGIEWLPRKQNVAWITIDVIPPLPVVTPTMQTLLDRIITEVHEHNEGRNLDCWPVLSFGWKDADLDAKGCTGIKSITWQDYKTLTVKVGGHKTFAYTMPEEDGPDTETRRDHEWEFLCNALTGYSCEGDSEEMTASFSDDLTIRLRSTVGATVEAILATARKQCSRFHAYMAVVAKDYEKIGADSLLLEDEKAEERRRELK